MAFCKEFNARTADQAGLIIPVEITVFEDRSFTFITKTPPAAVLLRVAAGIEKDPANRTRRKLQLLNVLKFVKSLNKKCLILTLHPLKQQCVWLKVLHAAWALSSKTNSMHAMLSGTQGFVEVGGSPQWEDFPLIPHKEEIIMAKHGKKYQEAS